MVCPIPKSCDAPRALMSVTPSLCCDEAEPRSIHLPDNSIEQVSVAVSNPMDCSSPRSSVHGILQARILECIAMPSCRGSSQPRDRPGSPTLQVESLLI